MSEQDNIKVVQANFAALNAHDLDKWSQSLTADAKAEGTGQPTPMNLEQNRMFLQGFLTAFPDIHWDVTRTIAQGNDVVMHWTGTGTHTGPLRTPTGNSIPATGKKAVVMGSSSFELKGGKISRSWAFWDMTSLLGQLGLMPPM
jgi:steroid delta-isomerase-like uncharacterized protein